MPTAERTMNTKLCMVWDRVAFTVSVANVERISKTSVCLLAKYSVMLEIERVRVFEADFTWSNSQRQQRYGPALAGSDSSPV